MARLARVVAAGVPHHVTQRGNRRQPTFFSDEDYAGYMALLKEWCPRWGVEIWAYCLMPNHVHLIAVPATAEALARAIGEVHRRYSRAVNFRKGWRGYLWQGRFASFPLDDAHLWNAARYVLLNPVRAGLAKRAEDWPNSSARVHRSGESDGLVKVAGLADVLRDWDAFLQVGPAGEFDVIRRHVKTGRPLGPDGFVSGLERRLGRRLTPGRPGRPRNNR